MSEVSKGGNTKVVELCSGLLRIFITRGVVLIFIIGVLGCATSVEERPLVLPKDYRAKLTKITVIPSGYTPYAKLRISAKEPMEGFGDYAIEGATVGATPGSHFMVPDQYGLILTAAGAIVGGLLGGVYGVVTEESAVTGKETAMTGNEATAVLQKAVIELKMQQALQEQVVKQARQKTHFEIASSLETETSFASQEGNTKEAVLIPYVLSFGLSREYPVENARLAVYLRAKVRLMDLADGKEICNVNFGFKTEYYEYAYWSSDDGLKFLVAINAGYENIAEQIVEELFLRQ